MLRLSIVLTCALALGACDSGPTSVEPESSRSTTGGGLLAVDDLPDGYVTSPPEPEPEVSGSSSVSVAGCDALIDHYRGGPADVRFEAGGTGPFLAEHVTADANALATLRDLAGRCASFTDTDSDGQTTTVTVTIADLPKLGDESVAFRMAAAGGSGDDAYTLGGYLIAARVKDTTCTLVHFGQPEVDRTETETIARTAVGKLQRRQ